MSTLFLFRQIGGARFGPHVETDDHDCRRRRACLRRRSEQHVGFGNRADARTNHLDLHPLGRELLQGRLQHFDRTLHVGLDNDQQFFDFALAERFDTALGRLQQRRLPAQHLTVLGNLLGASDVGNDLETITGLRNALKSEYFNRSRRLSFGNWLRRDR